MPVLFIGHGAPTLPLETHGAVSFLRGLNHQLPTPKAIAVISAHWETALPTVSSNARRSLLYDFCNFPAPLYRLTYDAPDAPEAAGLAYDLLRRSFPAVVADHNRGLDHGAWIPLLLMYPAAEIPVFQISIQHEAGPAGAYALGRALAPLRQEGILILASGGAVHNLSSLRTNGSAIPQWANAFDDFIGERLHTRRSLADYRKHHGDATRAHPRDEHLLPLMAAQGASTERDPVHTLYRGFVHGTISMAAYGFGVLQGETPLRSTAPLIK